MKSSRKINLQAFVKRERKITTRFQKKTLVAATASVSVLLAGCGSSTMRTTYSSIKHCTDQGRYSEAQCTTAYNQAEREAESSNRRRYQSRHNCEYDYGDNYCVYLSDGLYGPVTNGFGIAEIDEGSGHLELQAYPVYRSRVRYSNNNRYYDDDDNDIIIFQSSTSTTTHNTYQTTTSSAPPKDQAAKTVSKGGFGSTSSAKSSWSSSRRSSGWGG